MHWWVSVRLVYRSVQICTDTHQYLLPTSCHPKHCCKNIPYSLALRLRRICSDSNTFELRAKELTNQLHQRGYLKQDIASAIDKARQRSRDALLSYRPKSAEVGTILPFVLTYHPDLPKVRDIVDKNWSIIESSDELKDIYQSKPVMAFRRPKSLRDFLVRARLKPNSDDDNQTGECRPCGRKKMSMLQNDNLCWHCEVIFWGHCKTETEHRLHNRECCVSDLLQQLQQTVRRRNQRPIQQTYKWPS